MTESQLIFILLGIKNSIEAKRFLVKNPGIVKYIHCVLTYLDNEQRESVESIFQF